MLVAFSIWWPEFNHFRIARVEPDAAVIAKSSGVPASKKLIEIARIKFAVDLDINANQRTEAAEAILKGFLHAPSFLTTPLKLGDWPADLSYGSPTFQLAMASFATENLLLDEFESSGDSRFYHRARDRVLAFADWESRQREPYAFLWNDHAIAARIAVLIRVWNLLREDHVATPAQRASLVALIARSGELLAKPNQFTVRTNHGVIQNVALLQIAAAFPDLPQAPQWRTLALSRLELQMSFYVSDEGVVLEHSSGYHVFGHQLIDDAVQLVRLNGLAPSQRLLNALTTTSNFSRLLLRPDGTLPLVGNTGFTGHEDRTSKPESSPVSQEPLTGNYLFPLSGYSIWWTDGTAPSQTLVAWAKHDRHGHKHADEPSLHFWSQGFDWITATGYWPYGARGYEEANGWQGSNAPHATGEAAKSDRTVQLLGSGQAGSLRAIDIENVRASGLTVRRQVVQLSQDQLLVLDNVNGASTPVETLWTLDPRLTLQALEGSRYRTNAVSDGEVLQIDLAKDEIGTSQSTLYRGSWSPFAGWVVGRHGPEPASGLLVIRPSGVSMTATLFTVGKVPASGVFNLQAGSQAEGWTIDLQGPNGPVRVQRQEASIKVSTAQDEKLLRLDRPPSFESRQIALRAAMSHAIERYPPWRDLSAFHQRLYIGIFVAWVAVELMLGLLVKLSWRRRWMDGGVLAFWVGLVWWVHSIYLV